MGRRFVAARRVDPRRKAGVSFQPLEGRRLLATLNILSYGAIPNDGLDDRNAIVAAINASNDGDTIYFPAGTYHINKDISTHSGDVRKPLGRGRTYKGETTFTTTNLGADYNGNGLVMNDRSVLISTSIDPGQPNKKNSIFNFRETNPNPNTFNVKFSNLTFRGRGINLATNVGAMVEGVIIDNCHFDVQGGGVDDGVEFTTGLRNTQITNNIFHLGGGNGIYGYNWDRLTIANNWFLNPPNSPNGGSEAIHVIAHLYSSPDLLIEQNYFRGIRRMAIETQGGGVRTKILDNWYEAPHLVASAIPPAQPGNPTNDTFAYSIINDRAVDVDIRRNVAIMPTVAASPQNGYVRIVFELGGKNVNMTDNYSDGGAHVVAADGTGATGSAHDNRIMNFTANPFNYNGSTITFPNNGPGKMVGNTYTNSGPNVTLSFDPFTRLRPQPNIRYGQTAPPPPAGEPAAPSGLSANGVSSSQINLNWSDQAINETSYRVERWNGVAWIVQAILGADATSYSVMGLAPEQSYDFRVFAVNAQGDSASSNVATGTTAAAEKPATPTDLAGTTVGLNQINLTWTDNATNENGYRVERLSEDGSTWVVLTPELLPMDSTSYVVTSIAGGRTYQFRVIAVNTVDNVESLPSNIAVVQTPLADVGSGSTVRRARPAFFYSGSTGNVVGPDVTGAS